MVAHITNRSVRFAVCGMGRIGQRHARIISEFENAELVATCDIAVDHGMGEIPHFTSLNDLLDSDLDIDVVSLATPNGLHSSQAIECLRAGYHVLIEKPLALHKSDAERVIHTSLEVGKLVFGIMQNRYSPPSQWLKELVNKGVLGKIFHVDVHCYWNRDERYYKSDTWHGSQDMDGGTLFTQFSHFVDMIYWLFGDIENISGRFDNHNHDQLIEFEDTGLVHFDFKNGGTGSLQYSTSVWGQNLESSLTILAENGSVKVGGQYMNEVVHCHIKDYEMPELAPSNPPNDYGPYKGSAANHGYVIDNVIRTLRGETKISTNALEGMKVVDIIERIYQVRDSK